MSLFLQIPEVAFSALFHLVNTRCHRVARQFTASMKACFTYVIYRYWLSFTKVQYAI